jgi:HTH-type transcriptional regulator / antitoxin HipB
MHIYLNATAMEELGKLIRQARKTRQLSQAELAARLGMSRATISGIENNTIKEVGARKLEALLNMLGYTLTARPSTRRPTLDDLLRENPHG